MTNYKNDIKSSFLNYIDIGQRIQKKRIILSYTQRYVANKIGVSLSHISNIETGKTKPSLETLCKISRVLDCSIDELIFNDNISFNYKKLKLISESNEFESRVLEDIMHSIRENMKYLKIDDYRGKDDENWNL